MTAAAHERAKKRRELWLALTDFIQSHGGRVVSPPSGRYLRVEVPQGSSLPVRLAKVGYGLRHAGMTTRIGGGLVTVEALKLDLTEQYKADWPSIRHLATSANEADAMRCGQIREPRARGVAYC